jgi:tetratricopeptide (TPR) repeat protein
MRKSIFVFFLLPAALALYSCGGNQPGPERTETVAVNPEARFRKMVDSLSSLIRKDPQNDQLFSERSNAYFILKMADSAINDIEIAHRLSPERAGYLLRRADMELMRGQVEMAKTALTKILDRTPNHLEANLKMANLYMILEEYDMSRKILGLILKAEPNIPQALFLRSMVSQLEGNYQQAINDLMKAVTYEPNYYEAQNMLGLLHSYNRNDVAIDFFNNAINLRPDYVEPRYNLGYYYQETGRNDLAIKQYVEIINNIDSTALDPLFNMGYIFQEMGRHNGAIRFFEQAAAYHPDEARIYYRLGLSYEKLGNKKDAMKFYEHTLKIEPKFEEAFDALEKLTKEQ